MNRRRLHLPRFGNYAIGLLMIGGIVFCIVLGIRAESRVSSAIWFVAALAILPFLIARAFHDDAASYANKHLDELCAKKEAEALRGPPTASRTDIDHPALGHLKYDEQFDWYSVKVNVDGNDADLQIHCDAAAGEPPAFPHAIRIVRRLQQLCDAAKECAVRDLLKLKNETWRDEDEPEIDADEFKRLMKLEGIVVYGDGRAEFYHLDGDLFWGHCILVQMDADERFDNAHIAG